MVAQTAAAAADLSVRTRVPLSTPLEGGPLSHPVSSLVLDLLPDLRHWFLNLVPLVPIGATAAFTFAIFIIHGKGDF